jgi:hypothetical protein
VLGIPWLQLNDVAEQFASNPIMFAFQYCITHWHNGPVTVQDVTEEPLEPVYSVEEIFEPQIRPQRPFRGNVVIFGGASLFRTVRMGRLTLFKGS